MDINVFTTGIRGHIDTDDLGYIMNRKEIWNCRNETDFGYSGIKAEGRCLVVFK